MFIRRLGSGMPYEFSGKRALVTGASSGIGAALSVALASRGATLGLTARRKERLEEVERLCSAHTPGCRTWCADLGDPGSVDSLAQAVTDDFGGVDLLVNCGGMPKRRHVTRLDATVVERVMQVNFLGPARLTLALLGCMVEARQGKIVNVSSVAATLSSPGEAAYDASKAALSVWSEALAVDLWDSGVSVMTVYPGVVDTELFQLPDNDPPTDAVAAIPVQDAVAAIIGGIEADAVEVYVPEFFKELSVTKATDTPAFLSGTADFVRSKGK